MGPRHSREELLAGAVATASEHGLSRLTFGRVADHLGINDRTVVYYFPTKTDLVAAVVESLGAELQTTLAPAFASPASDHLDLTRRAWPVLAHPDADAAFALFFEANGLAAAGIAPYDTLIPGLVEAWIGWATALLSGPPATRRAEAEAAIALVDGLLLLRLLAGPDAAHRAAGRLGVA